MGVIMHNGVNYTRKAYEPKKPALVSWTTGTNDEITAMVNAYYDGKLSLDEIKSVWHLGDTRSVDLSAMAATYVSESHRAQTVELQILDFEHDDLTTAIGEKAKALITVDLKDILIDATVSDEDGLNNTENGQINSTNTNVGGWTSCARRSWCNEVFFGALPSNIKRVVKAVNKLTSAGNQSSTINTDSDYCFLLSEIEIFGDATWSKAGEGTQYAWFANATANRYKLPKWGSGKASDYWWGRSPCSSRSSDFCYVASNGSASLDGASGPNGLSPAFCL